MAGEDSRIDVAEPVAEPETPKENPVPSLDDLKTSAKQAQSDEERAKRAKRVPMPSLGFDLMVAKPMGFDLYDQLFSGTAVQVEGDGDDRSITVDSAFRKALIKNCVVQPKLDDEAVDLILSGDGEDALALFTQCMMMAHGGSDSSIGGLLGMIGTESAEGFTERLPGSTS